MNDIKFDYSKQCIEFDYSKQCIHCKRHFCDDEKPWISVNYENKVVNGCSYFCGNELSKYVGIGYWKNVINKEDFNEPRPVVKYKEKGDITANFGIEEIKYEISEEERRTQEIEDEYEDISSTDEEDFE